MATCGICHEDNLTEVGELDSCSHSFCFECIQHWAQIESRCPFCKARFTVINHKDLHAASLQHEEQADSSATQQLSGTVLQTIQVPERNQVYLGDEEYAGEEDEDPLGDVVCMECGRGDDEDNLLLCDGCERACHASCANLNALPEGDWFCWVCQQHRHVDSEGNSTAATTAEATSTSGRPRTRLRSSLVASDFTLPRGRRRAASPGAGSVLARRGRRVRRRLVRSGQESFVRGQGRDQRQASDADMILNALERSISSRDHSGLSTSSEHRRLAGLRGTWDSVRQGRTPFPQPTTAGPPAQIPSEVPQDDSTESTAWAAFEQLRQAQNRASRRISQPSARASTSRAVPSGPTAPVVSPPIHRQQTASSLARQAISEARSRGKQLGPIGMPAAYQRSRPAAMAASDRIRHSGPRSAHSGDCGTAPIHEHLASARHMHRTPSVRDDASRRPARFSHRAASPPVRDNIVRSPARFSYKAASPPVREDVLRRQAYESGRSHRGFSAADAPDQSTLLQVHRQSSSSQLQAQASMLQQGAAESTGGSVHTVSPALYGHDLQGDPSQHRAYAQAFVPNQSPAHGGSQHDRRSSVHAHTPSSLPWPHKQQQQAQPQTQHQAETQHLAELPDPYQALQPPQQQVQKAAAAPLNCAAVHEMNQYPAAGEIGQPPNCSVAAQQHHHQHHLLRHSSRLAVPPTSEWRGESNSSDSSGSSSSQVHPQQQSCIGAANHSQDHVDKKHGDDGPAQHVVCQANDARHVPLKQPAEPPQRTLSKQEAFDAVRTLLKPLYTDKLVSKEQFKAVAQSATHDLVKSQTSVEREIKQVVIGYLASAGLHQAVLQLS